MSTLYTGGASFGFSLNYNTAVPVDTRIVVGTLEDLKDPKTWVSGTYDTNDDTNNVYTVYPGLAVAVKSEATIYVFNSDIVSGTTLSDNTSWTKLATGGNADAILEELGVAEKAIGLNDNGEHKEATGNYTKGAETITEEISAIDSALKTTNDNIGTVGDASSKSTVYGAITKEQEAREKAINDLDSEFDVKDDHVEVKIKQEDGKITNVEVGTSDIAKLSKIEASSTIISSDKSFETALTLKYVAAVSGGSAAHLAIVDKNGKELSTVSVSDIIGNGLLDGHTYDTKTGILTLTFKQADGTTKAEEIDLSAMLDIDDVLVGNTSKSYIKVDLSGAEQSQAVFDVNIVKLENATSSNTGLTDAKDVKDYVDNKASDLSVSAAGDDYVSAAVDSKDNKKINITTNTANLVIGTSNGDSTLTGTSKKLADSSDIASKVSTFVNNRVNEEIAKLDATNITGTSTDKHVVVKVSETDGIVSGVSVETSDIASAALLGTTSDDKTKSTAFGLIAKEVSDRGTAISNLNASVNKTGTNVKVSVEESAGKLTSVGIEETYATITRTAKDSNTEAGLIVKNNTGLATGEDINSVARFAEDLVSAEDEAVKDFIDTLNLAKDNANANAQDSKGYIKTNISEASGVVKNEGITTTYGSLASGTSGIATTEDVESYTRFKKGTGTNSAILKGTGTTANNEAEVAIGKFNNSYTDTSDKSVKTIFSVGNGSSATDLHNAFEVKENGDIYVNIGTDYKLLQTILSNEIDWYEGD
jgi:hypothetical protein